MQSGSCPRPGRTRQAHSVTKNWTSQSTPCCAEDILALRQDLKKLEQALKKEKEMNVVCHAALYQNPSLPSYAIAAVKRKALLHYEGTKPTHCCVIGLCRRK